MATTAKDIRESLRVAEARASRAASARSSLPPGATRLQMVTREQDALRAARERDRLQALLDEVERAERYEDLM